MSLCESLSSEMASIRVKDKVNQQILQAHYHKIIAFTQLKIHGICSFQLLPDILHVHYR